MDKKKTGILIKEARIKKNYTQSELGNLLGVTNKAVSRWENGDSFPDIGILENLSGILDLKIQDIVVGEISEDESGGKRENIITEVIRMAKLQEKSRQKRIILYLGGGICLLLYSGMFNYMCTAEEELQMYIVRTVAVLVMMGCALLGFSFLRRRIYGGNDV